MFSYVLGSFYDPVEVYRRQKEDDADKSEAVYLEQLSRVHVLLIFIIRINPICKADLIMSINSAGVTPVDVYIFMMR